ncbi:dicarboxylate/amino acid:cation symporter [Natronospira bacteriovora]|uniref:Dicarboxylate/amino acid:cation symporter n=1 Tax=Natronospira bacteriovora TaxID=3069753 RepID=A0ABU0W6E9_9GAMM|nr:dicarboxylate/amino acid:cation symporter [Natronospira sp. AB-CW4]MDQ2069603.1 dicarboxylate/amino acid:cation symporter [Natronospira sp. AB-CW4]
MSETISGASLSPVHRLAGRLKGLLRSHLWAKVMLAMFLGIATGLVLGPDAGLVDPGMAALITNWLALPGYVFLALIQMIVIPLVVASIILGMASSESMESLRSVGLRAAAFFVVTTLAAVLIGMAVALSIQPGLYMDAASIQAELRPVPENAETIPAPGLARQDLPSRLSEMIPANPLKAGLEQNMMQVVVFAILIGVALVSLPPKHQRPLLELLASVQEITMVVVRWAMIIVPFAVFGLLAQITTRLGLDALFGMGLYVLTVIVGLLLVLLMYLAIYRIRTGRSSRLFLRNIRDAQLLAFSTSSSAAVMPLTMQTAEARLGVSAATTRFVIPLGTTINMAGTALYQMVATLFLAQVFGVDIGLAGLLLVVFLAVGASIGSPGTPGIGIVILAMLLGSVGIPASGIALIIGVDRILDMCRTTVNVTGDLVAASVLDNPPPPA